MWSQTYAPFGNMFISTLVAACPVIVLLASIGVFEIRAHISAIHVVTEELGADLVIGAVGANPSKRVIQSRKRIAGGYGRALPASSHFGLTPPFGALAWLVGKDTWSWMRENHYPSGCAPTGWDKRWRSIPTPTETVLAFSWPMHCG